MAGLISSSPSSHLFLQQFLRPPSKSPTVSSALLSLFVAKTHFPIRNHAPPIQTNSSSHFTPLVSSSRYRPPPLNLPIRCLSTPQFTTEAEIEYENDDSDGEEGVGFESWDEDSESDKVEEGDETEIEQPSIEISGSSTTAEGVESTDTDLPLPAAKGVESADINKLPLPSLSVKEKKELASYAHSLGKELRSQQIGKSGVTEAVATALIETLEKRELLKIKMHNNIPGEVDDAVKLLEKLTGSVVVSKIGRTVILYRPSLAKLKAEEKKKQNQIVFAKKQLAFKSQFQNRGQSRPADSGKSDRFSSGGNRFSSSRGGGGFSGSRDGSRSSSPRGDNRGPSRSSGSR